MRVCILICIITKMYTARTPILKCRAEEKHVLLYWRCVPSRMFYRQRSQWSAGDADIRHVGNRHRTCR